MGVGVGCDAEGGEQRKRRNRVTVMLEEKQGGGSEVSRIGGRARVLAVPRRLKYRDQSAIVE